MQFILAQIFAMYAYYFIDDNILFKDGTIAMLNLLSIPIILLALNNTMKERLPKSNVFINMLSYIVLSKSSLVLPKSSLMLLYLIPLML